jgi:3-phosphoshikimate 1-carboxyvinyltransferase
MPIKIQVPGSKSIANRALILASLSSKKINLKNIPECDDTKYLKLALKELKKKNPKIYTGNAGTTTRFITALSTLQGKKITINGDKRMHERPIKELTQALNKLGAKIEDNNGCPPLIIHPQKLKGGKIKIKGNISSQYISALLMVAPFAENNTEINIVQKLCSKPYVDMTLKLIKAFGLNIKNHNYKKFTIKGNQKIKAPKSFTIESDASSASYIGAYAALHPSQKIILENIHKNSIQGDIKFLTYLKKLKSSKTLNFNETPDLVMTFAILAMFKKGKTRFTNIENLRIKETDRLAALKNEISKLGIKVKTGKAFIEIEGNRKKLLTLPNSPKISIETYNDHRIAMCFGIIQDLIPCLKIKNPDCVSKSYTTFWKDLETLKNNQKNIVLTGLRGSGKTALAKMLSKKINWPLIDLDQEIEKLCKMKIANIVKKHGWTYFRKKEEEVTKKAAKLTRTIISTGGGTIVYPKNAKTLKKSGTIIYLKRLPKDSIKYINQKQSNRPSLTGEQDLLKDTQKIYQERKKIYEKTADHIINRTDDLDKDLLKLLRLHP